MTEEERAGNNPDNVERLETVANQKVKVYYAKEDTEFTKPLEAREPENLEGEKLESWRKERDNEINMKRSSSDKYDEAAKNRRILQKDQDELDDERQKFRKAQKEFEDKKATSIKFEAPDFNKILSAKSGISINSKQDVSGVMNDDPDIYHEAMMEYQSKSNKVMAESFSNYKDTDTANRMEKAMLKQKVENDGVNYTKFETWAKGRGFPINSFSLQSFKLENGKSSIADEINKSIPDTTELRWIPAGDVKTESASKSLEEEFPYQNEFEKYVDSEMQKSIETRDKRVIALMKE